MADHNASLLRLLLGEPGGHTDLERGRGLPPMVARGRTQRKRHALQSRHEDAVGETLDRSVIVPERVA